MAKSNLKKEFFTNNEVLFIGYFNRMESFCRMIYKAFTRNNIKVYPYNPKENPNYDIKVYKTLDEITALPQTAFILFNEDCEIKLIEQLAEKGVKKLLFQDAKAAKNEVVEECRIRGIETLVACPMMRFGKGLHRIHGFFEGVR
jgi:predicted CoA-binding protein